MDLNLRTNVTDAIKFWERGRIVFNLVLTAIVVLHFLSGYPTAKSILSLDFALGIFLLAVVANIAYCTAYLVDIFVQASSFRDLWRRYRWILLAIGTTFAGIITHFISSAMFQTNANR